MNLNMAYELCIDFYRFRRPLIRFDLPLVHFRFGCPVALHSVFPRNVALWHLFLISFWNPYPRASGLLAALPSIRKAYPYILVLSWMYSVFVQYYQTMHFCVRMQSTTNVCTACDSV